MKKKFLTVILGVLILLNLTFIYGNSLQKAETSNKISEGISQKVVSVAMPETTVKENGEIKTEAEIITENNIRIKKKYKFNEFLRQSFHAIEFFPLGMFLTLLFGLYIKLQDKVPAGILYGFLSLFLFALADETIQLFVDGRTFETGDILVDCVGGFVGILVAGMIITVKQNKNNTKTV